MPSETTCACSVELLNSLFDQMTKIHVKEYFLRARSAARVGGLKGTLLVLFALAAVQ